MASAEVLILAKALKSEDFRKFYLTYKLSRRQSPQDIELLMKTLDFAKSQNEMVVVQYLEKFVWQLKYSQEFLRYMLRRSDPYFI